MKNSFKKVSKEIKVIKLVDLEKKLAGGVTDSSPTDSLFCAYCQPQQQCRTVFWC